jgi:hypothetical protein
MVINFKLEFRKSSRSIFINFLVFILYIHFIWLHDKFSNRLQRMMLTNQQHHGVLKYNAVYFDASEKSTATIHVSKTSKFIPDYTESHVRRLIV